MTHRPLITSDDWQQLIGVQFALGGSDIKTGLNCYGLVRQVYRTLQIELPEQQLTEIDACSLVEAAGFDWSPLTEPKPFCIALIRSEGVEHTFHLAIVTPEQTLLHALPKKGVVVSPISGYASRTLGFYAYTPGQGERLPLCDGDVGRLIGTVAIMAASIGLALYTGGTSTVLGFQGLGWGMFAGAMVGVGVSMAGNMIMNALMPMNPDLSQLSGFGGSLADSRTYTWDGVVNDFRQGLVKPLIFGTVRAGGQIISEKTWFDADGNEYLDMLICPCKGKVARIGAVKLNDSGIELFKNASVSYRYGDREQLPLNNFRQVYLQYSSAAKLPYDASTTDPASVLQFSSKRPLTGIRFTVTAPQGLFELSGNVPSARDVTFHIQYRPSGGAWTNPPGFNPSTSPVHPFIRRTTGVFTGSANPYTLTDSGAGFDAAVAAAAEFQLEIGATTYYCTQTGSLTSGDISFDAFSDAGRTTPVTGALTNGTYLLHDSETTLYLPTISVYFPDPPPDPPPGGDPGGG
jgi:hypothetical protein